LIVFVGAVVLMSTPGGAAARSPVRSTGGLIPTDRTWPQQDAAWLTAKRAHRVIRGPDGVHVMPPATRGGDAVSGAPSSVLLPYAITAHIVEPDRIGYDDSSPRKYYDDRNYWNFCAPGAATVAAYYFGQRSMGMTGTFHEPYGPHVTYTHWNESDRDTDGYNAYARAYLLYMAEQVRPPTFGRPGIDDFDDYPTRGGSTESVRDALNWEITDQGMISNWASFFYTIQPNTGSRFSLAHLNADVVSDVYGNDAAVVVSVDADYLPNWRDLARPLYHSITVIGYDNDADTYTYVDTCGVNCGSNSNGGLHTISQKQLFKAIQMVGRVDSEGQLIRNADGLPKYPWGAYIW